jgi:hypothetical protein
MSVLKHFSTTSENSAQSIIGCTRGRNVERGTKGFRVRKTSLSSTLVKLRYDQ